MYTVWATVHGLVALVLAGRITGAWPAGEALADAALRDALLSWAGERAATLAAPATAARGTGRCLTYPRSWPPGSSSSPRSPPGVGIASGRLALGALAALAAHLALYVRVAAPIDVRLTAAAARGEVPAEARAWQRRWDGVIVPRAALPAPALGALAAAALAR